MTSTLVSILFVPFVALFAAAPADAPAWPDPARLEADVRAIERADSAKAVSAPPRKGWRVVAIGSSSIRMWDTIERDLQPLTIVPHGFGGSTMHDALVYADRLILPLEPDAILLYEGDNDIEAGIAPERVAAEFTSLVHRVRAKLPVCRFYVLSIKPSPARWKFWDAARLANGRLREACKAQQFCTFVDVASPMLDPKTARPRPELYLPDSLHMTAKGYEVWRSVVRRALFRGELRPMDGDVPGIIPGELFEGPESDVEADSIPSGPRVGALGGVDRERTAPACVGREERGFGRDVRVDRARDLLEQCGAASDLPHVDGVGHTA